MRKLATIRKIDALTPIVGADAIDCAHIGGWKVVVKKGEYTVGDLAVYIEIDSWVPHTLAPFLSKGNYPRVYNEVEGERLRTIKLRGQLSQGLLLPTNIGSICVLGLEVGMDVSAILGIQKWEPALEFMSSDAKGEFPSQIPKTDQERVQNIPDKLIEWKTENLTWEVTEKLEGSSMTAYLMDDEFGVCSRNINLKPNPDATFWKTAIEANLECILRDSKQCLALQGELVGEGIQGNIYKLKGTHFYIYDIYDIRKGEYFTPTEREAFAFTHKLKHVPVWQRNFVLNETTIDELLIMAEEKSMVGTSRCEQEGIVFKCNEKKESFKVISNRYLLKSKD